MPASITDYRCPKCKQPVKHHLEVSKFPPADVPAACPHCGQRVVVQKGTDGLGPVYYLVPEVPHV